MKVIIAGGRDFKDYDLLRESVDSILKDVDYKDLEIVSGKQKSYNHDTGEFYGADYLGERWAEAHGVSVIGFPANWKKHGVAGGPIRNKAMSQYSDILILFWDGQSKGSKSMLGFAQEQGLRIHIIYY